MKYIITIILIITFQAFAQETFPLKRMVCSGYVVNAPVEFHEGYYYIGAVITEKNGGLDIYNCLGPSISYVNNMIKNGKCGYSGLDHENFLKYKKVKNKTLVYNDNQSLKLFLGFQTPQKIYQLSGQYSFWGHLAPETFYQVDCKAVLKK